MPATVYEIAEAFNTSKTQVNRVLKTIDPDMEHITVGSNKTWILDDYLTQLVSDELKKRAGESTRGRRRAVNQSQVEQIVEPDRKPKIKGAKHVISEAESLKAVYEDYLSAEREATKRALDENERLRDEIAELKRKIETLEDKVDAERARYDTLTAQTIQTLSQPKPGFFRRLLGWGKKDNA